MSRRTTRKKQNEMVRGGKRKRKLCQARAILSAISVCSQRVNDKVAKSWDTPPSPIFLWDYQQEALTLYKLSSLVHFPCSCFLWQLVDKIQAPQTDSLKLTGGKKKSPKATQQTDPHRLCLVSGLHSPRASAQNPWECLIISKGARCDIAKGTKCNPEHWYVLKLFLCSPGSFLEHLSCSAMGFTFADIA